MALFGLAGLLFQATNGPSTSLLDWVQSAPVISQLPVPPLPTGEPFASQ